MTQTRRGRLLGALAACGAAVVLAGCSAGPVPILTPPLDADDTAACEQFLEDLPPTLNDEDPREVEPAESLGAAYGDPPIAVTCGVEQPEGFDRFAFCEEVNDVGWYAPREQYDDQEVDVTIYSVSYSPIVRIDLPADYRPDGLAAALAELATPVKDNFEKVDDCV